VLDKVQDEKSRAGDEVEMMTPVGVLQMKEMVEVGQEWARRWRAWTVLTRRGLKQLSGAAFATILEGV
ncbi:hypothetical protein Tco_1120070, partial [Tanacetum coccineum]